MKLFTTSGDEAVKCHWGGQYVEFDFIYYVLQRLKEKEMRKAEKRKEGRGGNGREREEKRDLEMAET